METRKKENKELESQSPSRHENDKTWRDEKPTEKQLSLLKNLGYVGEDPPTRGDASDLIEEGLEVNGKKSEVGMQVHKERLMTQMVFVDVSLFDSEKRTLAQVQINMYLTEGFQIQRDWDYDGGTVMVLLKYELKPVEEEAQ